MNKATALFSGEESVAYSGEESGWTTYFDDFFSSQKKIENGEVGSCNLSSTSIVASSSLISDAASCAQWKLPPVSEAPEGRKKLSFKKEKATRIVDDDPLEDTASSHVSNTNHVNSKGKKKEESRRHLSRLQEKSVAFENCTELGRGEMVETGFSESANECTELRKKGLCLVPLSMLVNYLE